MLLMDLEYWGNNRRKSFSNSATLAVGAAAWIYAGGTHHSAYTLALTPEFIESFAEIADVEYVVIDKNTCLKEFKKELKWNEIYYMLANGLK